MKVKSLMVFTLVVVILLPVMTFGQTWSEEQIEQAKAELQDKFQVKESLSPIHEGALETDTAQVLPADVRITEEGLIEGLTVGLVKYGEDNLKLLFVASVPDLDPPYGAALMSDEGEVLSVSIAEIQGTKDGPDNPNIELLKTKEETYKLALHFPAATIRVEIPKNTP